MQNLKLTKLKPGLIRLLHHPASNWIGPILQLTGPTWGIDDLLFYSVLFYSKKSLDYGDVSVGAQQRRLTMS